MEASKRSVQQFVGNAHSCFNDLLTSWTILLCGFVLWEIVRLCGSQSVSVVSVVSK